MMDAITTITEVYQALRIIRKTEEEQAKIEAERDELVDFMKQRIDSKQKAIDFQAARIRTYLETTGEKTVKLPVGTAQMKELTKNSWPDDEVLVEFSRRWSIPLKEKVTPSKTDILKYIEDTGNYPDGFTRHKEVSFSVRTKADTAEDAE